MPTAAVVANSSVPGVRFPFRAGLWLAHGEAIRWQRPGPCCPVTMLRNEANCLSSVLLPTKSPFSALKLTANLARGEAKLGISLPSGSMPSS